MVPDRCFIYTNAADLDAAVAAGRVSEHDAQIMRQFADFLEQAPPLPPKETSMTSLDLVDLAARIARGVGTEFPAPPHEMVQRSYPALVEEADELDDDVVDGNLAGVREESADCVITAYLVAHYVNTLPEAPNYRLDLDAAVGAAFPGFDPGGPDIVKRAARIAGPLRRFLGHARRSGSLEDLALVLGQFVLTTRAIATQHGFDLDQAIAAKAEIIFGRGWREAPSAAH